MTSEQPGFGVRSVGTEESISLHFKQTVSSDLSDLQPNYII